METVNKREIFLPELHEKQIEIVENQSRFKVLSAGRRWGKTLLGCWLCIAYALEGKLAWWVAPTYTMA